MVVVAIVGVAATLDVVAIVLVVTAPVETQADVKRIARDRCKEILCSFTIFPFVPVVDRDDHQQAVACRHAEVVISSPTPRLTY
jgi:hypothetical protein